uniref:Ras-associating domain-containing protein n=1 Tax=Trichobilharzia regenti TaxID=157069 RepID=A0AA85KC91_TRIRE|nr:unnamed protein product [Trichobilharzia regenti]
MLTTALNFLSDKRKRFHRSDTMPIFTNDTSSFKLNSDNQLVENDELSVKDKDCNNEEQQEVGIVSARGYKKSNVHHQNQVTLGKSVCYQGGLLLSTKSCAAGRQSGNDDNDDCDDDEDEEDDDDDGHCDNDDYNTNSAKLPTFSSNEKYNLGRIKMLNKQHHSVNNLDKYKFLDLETNLQRHQKNLSNSPPRENIPYGHLSHGYSLSNVQVTSNQTGSETSVFSSANLLKKGFGGENSTLKGGKIHNIRFIRPPVELNESQPLISGDLDNEQMSYTSSKTNSSGKSKVAKMRARAAARAAKGKLKRSKSSAYMSRQFRNPPLEDSSIRGRSSSTHRKSNNNNLQENQSLQNSTENKSRSGLVRGWIDKNASTKLDSSLQSNIQTGNLSEIVDISEGFDQLINKANTYKFQIINALEHSKSLTESKEISNELQTDQKTSCLTDNQYAPKILSSRQVIASTNSTVKPNRYSVVRKLRRNNSSITCSSEQISTLHEDQSIVSTNSTAGDLLLPSKNYKTDKFTFEEKDENAKNLIVKLFTIIKYDDFDQFIKLLDHYQRLSEPSLRQVQKATNEFGLSALDSAHLTSSLPLISCLLVCGFLPGPVLQPILNSSTKSYSHKIDTMGRYLENLLEEKEIQLTKYKVETKNAILRANHLSKIEMQKDFSSSIQLNQQCEQFNNSNNTIAFAEVAMREKELQAMLEEYDYLSKLIDNYSKYPRYTKPPSKVNIFLNSSNSILIRITPPKNDRFTEISLQNSTGKATSDDDNNNNDNNPLGDTRSEYEINFDQSSCDSTDDNNNDNNDDINLIQDSINEGRKINDVNKIHSNNFILRYCIEWSTCPKFSNSQVYSYLVQPPIRINRPHSQAINKVNQSTSLRVGFYCINNLPENKMIFIRVFAFSIRGWSQPCYAYPKGLVLSSWITNKICDLYRTTIQRDNSLSLSYTKYVGGTLDEEISTVKNHLCQQLSSWAHNYPVNSNVNCNTANPAAAATTITTAVATVPSSSSSTTTTTTTTGVPVNISEETTSKRTKSPMLQRKRSFRFPFSNKGLKFIRQTKSGVYLAVLYHTPTISSNITSSNESEKFKYKSKIVLADDYIPILNISREDQTNESVLNSDFNWLSRIVSDSFYDMDIQFLYEDIPNTSLPTNLQLRVRLLETLQRLKLLLGTSNLGSIYPEIIRVQTIDTCLTNYLKQPKHETLDNCENASTPKVSTETNDSTTTSTSYESSIKPTASFLFVLIKQINNPSEIVLTGNLRWCYLDKFLRQNKIKLNKFFQTHSNILFSNYSIKTNMTKNILLPTLYPHLLTTRNNQVYISPECQLIANLDILLGYSELHKHLLEPGLYVVHVQMKAHLDQQAAILVSNTPSVIHMLPAEKIRSRSHVSYSEWYSLCRLVEKTDEKTEENFFNFKNSDKRFIIQLIKAIFKLANRLCYDINDMKMFRIFLPEIIRISPVHAFILLFPSIDQVCVPPTLNTPPPPTCSWIPMTYFERNLGLNYDPLFHNKIQHLISLLELIIPLSQFAQRQCLTESNLSQLSERTQSLQSIQTNLENMFQTRRWLSETISVGRDRKKLFHFHINLEQILNEYHSILKTTLIKLNLDSLTDETIEFNKASRIAEPATALMITDKTKLIRSSSVHSDLADTLPTSERVDINNLPSSPAEPKYKVSNAVIQVYADYPTGLTSGVSVRLLINMRTTVKEVIEIVVKQLLETAERKYNKASDNSELSSALSSFEMLRNNTESNLENHLYCLTVSVGQLERCLPNTVRLLLLRRPWRFGKLTIRLVNNLSESISQQKLPSSSSQEPTSPSSELTNFPSAVDKSISPLVRVTYVEPNLKQASITSPPEVLH